MTRPRNGALLAISLVMVGLIATRSQQGVTWTQPAALTTGFGNQDGDDDASSEELPIAHDPPIHTMGTNSASDLEEGSVLYKAVGSEADEEIHFTHIFAAYDAPDARTETALVRASYLRAAKFAAARNDVSTTKVNVEFLVAWLKEDEGAMRAMRAEAEEAGIDSERVRDVPLTRRMWGQTGKEGERENHYPTVGEVFQLARTQGRGRHVVYTNADIGLNEDFYVKIQELIARSRETRKKELKADLRTAVRRSRAFLRVCSRVALRAIPEYLALCASDAAHVFYNACMSCRYPVFRAVEVYLRQFTSYEKMGAGDDDAVSDSALESDLAAIATTSGTGDRAPIGMTITRLDFLNLTLPSMMSTATTTTTLLEALRRKRDGVSPHPGNDCFVLPRDRIPPFLDLWIHPLGFRPWGNWLQQYYALPGLSSRAYTTRHPALAFKRITSEVMDSNRRYTWHLGKGEWRFQADHWMDRVRGDPALALFLAAHWNHISAPEGLSRSILDPPPTHCLNRNALYKHAVNVCGAAFSPRHPHFCQGAQPLSCANYLLPRSRDAGLYRSICANRPGIRTRRPACEFCEVLWGSRSGRGAVVLLGDDGDNATTLPRRRFPMSCTNDSELMDECATFDRACCA